MNCRNFSQFDEWIPARLVWAGSGEAPEAAGGETPPPAEAKPEDAPVDAAAAAAAQAAEGERRQEAITAGQPNPREAEDFLLSALGDTKANLPMEKPSAEKIQEIHEKYNDICRQLFTHFINLYRTEPSSVNIQQQVDALIQETKQLNIPKPDVQILFYGLFSEPNETELKDFEAKYMKNGTLNMDALGTLFNETSFDIKKTREVFITIFGIRKYADDYRTQLATLSPESRSVFERILGPRPEILTVFRATLDTEALAKYKDKFDTYLAAQDPVKAKEELLASVEEKDRDTVRRLIESDPTKKEQDDWIQAKFKGAKPSAEVLYQQITTPGVNFRERIIAASLISEEDIQALQKEGKLTEAQAARLYDFKESRKKAAAESQDKIPDELKGLGFMGLLEKLIEKLTKLMEKLTGQLDKAFAKKSDQFDTSPIGGDQKFTIETAPAGINLRTEKAGADVKPVTGGTVDSVEGDKVIILAGKGKVVYQGLIPAAKKGDTVEAGKTVLGKMKDTVFNFQMINEDGKQIPEARVAELLGKYAQKPPEAKAKAPELKVTQWPIALAGDAKLNITKDFTQTDSKGVEITAAKNTSVMMMADGIITKSENGTVEVTYKYGKVMKFTGLKNDTSLHAANANEVIKAGVAIGAVGDTGILGIQIIENGTQIDPASPFLANYLPAAPAPTPAAAQNTAAATPSAPSAPPAAAKPA